MEPKDGIWNLLSRHTTQQYWNFVQRSTVREHIQCFYISNLKAKSIKIKGKLIHFRSFMSFAYCFLGRLLLLFLLLLSDHPVWCFKRGSGFLVNMLSEDTIIKILIFFSFQIQKTRSIFQVSSKCYIFLQKMFCLRAMPFPLKVFCKHVGLHVMLISFVVIFGSFNISRDADLQCFPVGREV